MIARISADHDQRRIQDLSKGADYGDRGAQAYIEGLHGESASRVQRKSPENESFFSILVLKRGQQLKI